jgi:hypothetical protein
MIEGIVRLFQLRAGEAMFREKMDQLVSAEDQTEFFGEEKTATRARLVKYLTARADKEGLRDIITEVRGNDRDQPGHEPGP